MFVHLVFFWLKEQGLESARDRLVADGESLLRQIPTVRHLWAGRPAMTPRDVVDNSYDVGLCVVLDDRVGHDAYQAHPLHEQFLANHKQSWQRVQVYDFETGAGPPG